MIEWFFNNAWYLFMIESVLILVLWDITGTRKDDIENECDKNQHDKNM